jgi:OmcA/MtrC family decaheme c-type cytochrome
MRSTLGELAVVVLVVGLTVACKGDPGPAGPPGAAGATVVPTDTAQNLNVALSAARVTSDRKVQVDYTLTDPSGAGIAAASDVASSWTLAVLGKDAESNLAAWQSLVLAPVTGAKGQTNQPTTDTKGTSENLGGGKYRYTYATVLPAGFDADATYRVGVFQRRPIPNTAGLNDVANGILDFVPNGGTPQQHDLVSTQACNGCHSTLKAHGGFRRETRLCATCHTTQLVDPDTNDTNDPTQLNPLDFGRLVHRVHRGKDLPTVQAANAAGDTTWAYHVIGFQNADNVYGSVIPNPNTLATPATPATVTAGVGFPRDLRSCGVCHAPAKDAQGNVLYGAESDAWKTSVSRRTCTSCHDSSWFKDANPPKYHVAHQVATHVTDPPSNPLVPLTDDTRCATCHSDVRMAENHTSPFASPSFNAIVIKINSVTATTPPTDATAGTATVNFSVSNKLDGTPVTDLVTLGSGAASAPSLSANLTGPTRPDFSGSSTDKNIVTANARCAPVTATPCAAGTTGAVAAGAPGTYTLTAPIPAGATGTWAVGMEARRGNVALTAQEKRLGNVANTATATFNEFAINPVAYFNVSGTGTPQLRRQVVAFEKCNACHETLSVHGGLRHDPQYCVMCHTPDNTDIARRPSTAGGAALGPPVNAAATLDKLGERSIHLKPMIHSIHTGEELQTQKPFIIYGNGGSVNRFDEVRFPSSRANCQLCHVGTTFTLDSLPLDASPTRAMQIGPATLNADGTVATAGLTATVGPVTAACIACHDTPDAHTHAEVMTTTPPGGAAPVESCRVCHGETADFAVSRMHRLAAQR